MASIGAAGSIGSAGSIGTAGSISANRGSVNEVTQIVTHGETGAAVIGVSGYNGAFSSKNYVLRVKVTPPPPQLPCDPITGMSTRDARDAPVGELAADEHEGALPGQPPAHGRPLRRRRRPTRC